MRTETETKDWLLGEIVSYADESKRKPIWEMTKEIKVKIFDWQPLLDKINVVSQKKDGINFEVRCGNGIIFVGENKLPVLIDDECCGVEGERKNLFFDGAINRGTMIDGVGLFKKVNGGIAMYPTIYVDFDYEEIEKCFTGEEKELWEFMGSRYEYNPRITQNMRGIVELYKGIEKRKR
jgi:hypothetical protein